MTHETKEKKISIIRRHGIPAVEIDLSKFYQQNSIQCRSDLEFVKPSWSRHSSGPIEAGPSSKHGLAVHAASLHLTDMVLFEWPVLSTSSPPHSM